MMSTVLKTLNIPFFYSKKDEHLIKKAQNGHIFCAFAGLSCKMTCTQKAQQVLPSVMQ